MRVLVAYSSLSGGTKRLAEGIFTSLPYEEKTLATIQEAPSLEGYDAILVGYWANQGAPGQDVQQFLKTIHGKAVGVFATLAYHPDTNHGWGLVQKGIDLVKEDNAILGSFVCNGALSPAMLKMWRTPGPDGKVAATPENEIRWKVSALHPTPVDIAMAAERFRERLSILEAHQAQGLTFKSIL